MTYPTPLEVLHADRAQLGRWVRFLPSPGFTLDPSDPDTHLSEYADQVGTMTLIMDRFRELGGWDAVLSKEVGWDAPK